MIIQLKRVYETDGTSSVCSVDGKAICFAIELPWRNNERRISCIPEGVYTLSKRYSAKYKHHLLVNGTEPRDLILIHPANDARTELMGCIAPVTNITGPGRGGKSRLAFNKIMALSNTAFKRGEIVELHIVKA